MEEAQQLLGVSLLANQAYLYFSIDSIALQRRTFYSI